MYWAFWCWLWRPSRLPYDMDRWGADQVSSREPASVCDDQFGGGATWRLEVKGENAEFKVES